MALDFRSFGGFEWFGRAPVCPRDRGAMLAALTLGQPEVIHDTLWRRQNGNAYLLVTFEAAAPERIAHIHLALPT
jgi:hypothetical protein